MLTKRVAGALCGALVSIAGAAGMAMSAHAAGDATPGSDEAAIEALERQFVDAFNAKDLDAIMKVYAPGSGLFVFDVAPPRQYVGWADYRTDWKAALASLSGSPHFAISDLSITVVGAVAYGHSIQRGMLLQSNGRARELIVRVTDVYRKIRGRWLIVQEHVSVPVDVGTGKADLLSRP